MTYLSGGNDAISILQAAVYTLCLVPITNLPLRMSFVEVPKHQLLRAVSDSAYISLDPAAFTPYLNPARKISTS